jgi:rfaE bifunctional protein nucleotidyltransferase chain/domain/rfaE bifunctional protein kinase chain/domain
MSAASDPHVSGIIDALLTLDRARLARWGERLAALLPAGSRLLVAGNGGSAAQAQHMSAELVGRFRADRPPLSALALHADTSTVTAVGNDFGFEEVFARQVQAHGRPGDILLALSTSGRSANIVRAVSAAAQAGLTTWALTGPAPSPVTQACDEYVAVDAAEVATIQECHLAAIHLICAAVDDALCLPVPAFAPPAGPAGSAASPAAVPGPGAPPPEGGRRPLRLVIVGDVLLDRDLSGEAERISPEAPVPVVGGIRQAERPGGAGLAAVLGARDGHDITLITALGEDEPARLAAAMLSERGVKLINLGTSSATAVKTRVRARGQTMLMLDDASEPSGPGPLSPAGRTAIGAAAAVLVSDYGRGVAAAPDVREALSEALRRTRVVWDPHPRGPAPVPGVTVVTPNSLEARHFAEDAQPEGLAADIGRARRLLRRWDAGQVVITRGPGGAIMVSGNAAPPLVLPAPVVAAGDSCGAGDRFAVSLTARLASGAMPSAAVTGAVIEASQFVAGTTGHVRQPGGPGISGPGTRGEVLALAALIRAAGGRLVATGGCFDLLHRGHLSLLQQARQLGDCLIVCLNSDASASRLKGPARPLVTAPDRAAVLAGLSCVDAVIVFEEETPAQVLAMLRPHVYVKGGDYAIAGIPERTVIEQFGGQVVLVPYLDGRSTTSLIEQVAVRRDRARPA